MKREDRRQLMNEFRDALVEDCLDKARDYEDVAYYAQEVMEIHKPWDIAGDEQHMLQTLNGAVRKCSNKKFKGKNANAAGSVLARALDAAQEAYYKKHGYGDGAIVGIQKRERTEG